jgi:hypothetical protein
MMIDTAVGGSCYMIVFFSRLRPNTGYEMHVGSL